MMNDFGERQARQIHKGCLVALPLLGLWLATGVWVLATAENWNVRLAFLIGLTCYGTIRTITNLLGTLLRTRLLCPGCNFPVTSVDNYCAHCGDSQPDDEETT